MKKRQKIKYEPLLPHFKIHIFAKTHCEMRNSNHEIKTYNKLRINPEC